MILLFSILLFHVGTCTHQLHQINKDIQPAQVHLSYGAYDTEMVATWITVNYTSPSVAEFGLSRDNLSSSATGEPAVKFTDGGTERRTFYIHVVKMQNLSTGMKYYYRVGSSHVMSAVYYFQAKRTDPNWSPSFAIFADMGSTNDKALPMLEDEAKNFKFDIALHSGDFAYDMDKDNGRVGDAFMQEIESVAAYVPYMTCVGNHEHQYNFSHYRYRFTMPTKQKLQTYYSFNVGPAHIVSVDTEVYYYDSYSISGGDAAIREQYSWLLQDLQDANTKENRAKHPWIIVIGHRPMYCSNSDGQTEHCNNLYHNKVRTGIPEDGLPGLEEIFYKYGVDVQFYAHEHSYERLYPVYKLSVCNGSKDSYTEPRAPVHIISGSAGNDEGQTNFDKVVYPWSAFHTDDFGYTRMKIVNRTHIHFQQVSVDKGGQVIDEMILIKNKHGAGLYDCHKSSWDWNF